MADYIEINEAVNLMSQAGECQFKVIPRKRILFRGVKQTGETIILCAPQSKLHPQGFYWVDITEEQKRVLDETDKGVVMFRLEGRKLVMVSWKELKLYLLEYCKKYNPREGYHWKLNIYDDHIKISGNPNIYRVDVVQY